MCGANPFRSESRGFGISNSINQGYEGSASCEKRKWRRDAGPVQDTPVEVEQNTELPDYLPEDESPTKEQDKAVSQEIGRAHV